MYSGDEIQQLKGIGEKTAKLFHKLNIDKISDLLSYYPRDYDRFQNVIPVSQIKIDKICAVRACLVGSIQTKRMKNLRISTAIIADDTSSMQITFYNMPYINKSLENNCFYVFRGIIKQYKNRITMEQPKIFKEDDYNERLNALQPIYIVTKGISSSMIQKTMKQVLSQWKQKEFLTKEVIEKYNLMDYSSALQQIHMPMSRDLLLESRKRIVFNEFFLFLLAIRKRKDLNCKIKNINFMLETADTKRLLEKLPYQLTNAQSKVWNEVKADLSGNNVMNRLIQGDVGSGKTIIAVLSLLMCVANGYQGAMMAPTEVLAKQHFEAVRDLTAAYKLPLKPILLTGSLTAKEKKEVYSLIESGKVNVIFGTHALIQEKVVYKNLALVVTDEQHRFGVRQREALAGKGESVHVLVMSATPIPRTLAIILYGDLHLSVIDELPANRMPIKNCVVNIAYRKKAYEFMEKEITCGRQIYIICPMVEEGELENVENVTDYTNHIKQIFPPQIRIDLLHGKMKTFEKNRIMESFKSHDIDILVSTTVIEVGINVPNATVMMIENAERFGLAQLHQLRGRVGRGKNQSYCIFISGNENKNTLERLEILNHSNDGFLIAEEDMKLRGPGDIFGIRQSGQMDFKLADIYTDASILKMASEAVDTILREDADFVLPKNEDLKDYIERNRLEQVDFRSI